MTSIILTASSGKTLSGRWHDQPLDLEGLRFDKAKGECVLFVLERRESDGPPSKRFVQEDGLQRCRVTAKNITDVQIAGAQGEVELYIVEVKTTPSRLSFKCVNGVLDLFGENIEVVTEEDPAGAGGEARVTLTTPLGNISWRKKRAEGKR